MRDSSAESAAASSPAVAAPAPRRAGRRCWRLAGLLGLLLALNAAALAARRSALPGWESLGRPPPATPRPPELTLGPGGELRSGAGWLERIGPHRVLHLAGTPEELGAQHGRLLRPAIRFMLKRYLADCADRADLRAAAHRMRASLPPRFVRELDACAAAAGVEPDLLLLAQCEGDLREAVWAAGGAPEETGEAGDAACTSYVAFGPATAQGRLEAGRNLDYYLGEGVLERAALVAYYRPAPGDGHRFATVGLAGILTGWTLVNEHGLIVANHLGGGLKSRLDAIPTLLLAREVAQHAATVEEGLALLRAMPRMRGQIIWLAQPADPATGRAARAVAVEYDAREVWVQEAMGGVLIVTNENLVFGGIAPPEVWAGSHRARLTELIAERRGILSGRQLLTRFRGVLSGTTQTVQALPEEGEFLVVYESDPPPAPGAGPIAHPWPGKE